MAEFSFRTRDQSLERFEKETFDLLIIGGGITGAATARDAASRGLSVALIDKNDFAYGTSSRSSKLIHGGLRYLQNFEFHLVFEALAERALLLKTAPNMVRPLPFYFPVYRGDANGKSLLSIGMWLYDLLALFRTPGFHKNLSKKGITRDIPFLKQDGLLGGFRYFDASMWDDVMVIEILRSASSMGAAIANYVEAVSPLEEGGRVSGYQVRDVESQRQISLRAKQVVVCAGPWTDRVAKTMDPDWHPWIKPSKGVHLIFDLKRIPIPGAMVMSSADGRIAFVIPRPDFGSGVVIVGTTDGPTPENAETGMVLKVEVDYLLGLLSKYFPDLKLSASDILSAYVGVRPLMGEEAATKHGGSASPLQKVSREHHIDRGPHGCVMVAGGKYTTHRKMAEEIVETAMKVYREDTGQIFKVGPSKTHEPVNPLALPEAVARAKANAPQVATQLWDRYGAEAVDVTQLNRVGAKDPDGFPCLDGQLRFSVEHEMVLHLDDFYFRRCPLFASRADHGMPWAESLGAIIGSARGVSASAETARLREEIEYRDAWRKRLTP